MADDLLYKLALTTIPNIGPVQAKILLQHFDVKDIFKSKKSELEKIEGIGAIKASSIKTFTAFAKVEEEIKFIERYKIKTLFITDKEYPRRFLNCYDPPTILFVKGGVDLNVSKTIGIVGTRKNSDYGKEMTEGLVQDLSAFNPLIISGLAFGIDSIAHKAALRNGLCTVAALGHGLDTIYPKENTALARDMVRHGGGLITEFFSRTKPDKQNFPRRNRIVAGLCDAIIIVETDIKGGSMITAELANGYNRDVFAIPGRVADKKSSGTNYLIRNNKAVLLTDAQELIELMGWETKSSTERKRQKEIFIELSDEEKIIVDILKEQEAIHIDEINFKAELSSSTVAAAILNLELKNLVAGMPGKMYKLQ